MKKPLAVTITIKVPKLPDLDPVIVDPAILAQMETAGKALEHAFARMAATINSAEECARIDREMLETMNAHRCPVCGIPVIGKDEPACVMCVPRVRSPYK